MSCYEVGSEEETKKFFLILEKRLVMGAFEEDSMLAHKAFEYSDGYWAEINCNEINDRLMGYDPTESDSSWALGNTEIMDQIRKLSDEEFEIEIRKQFDKLGFLYTFDEVLLMKQFAAGMAEAYAESDEEDRGDIPFFYFRDKKVVNPWMDERGEYEVEAFVYYGKETVEEQLINLGLTIDPEKSPEEAKVIYEKCKQSLEPEMSAFYDEVVNFAMSEEQAAEEGCSIAFGQNLPDGKGVYYKLSTIPSELATYEGDGWMEKVSFSKKNAKAVLEYLYSGDIPFDYERLLDRIKGDIAWLLGFGD